MQFWFLFSWSSTQWSYLGSNLSNKVMLVALNWSVLTQTKTRIHTKMWLPTGMFLDSSPPDSCTFPHLSETRHVIPSHTDPWHFCESSNGRKIWKLPNHRGEIAAKVTALAAWQRKGQLMVTGEKHLGQPSCCCRKLWWKNGDNIWLQNQVVVQMPDWMQEALFDPSFPKSVWSILSWCVKFSSIFRLVHAKGFPSSTERSWWSSVRKTHYLWRCFVSWQTTKGEQQELFCFFV